MSSNFAPLKQPEPSKHNFLTHYCNFDSFEKILHNKTFRCSNLSNPDLNDPLEAKRKNIEREARKFFVASFTHREDEYDYFWKNYGGEKYDLKLALKFKNFCSPTTITEDYIYRYNKHFCQMSNGNKAELCGDYCDDEISVHNKIIQELKDKGSFFEDFKVNISFKDIKYEENKTIQDQSNLFPINSTCIPDTRMFGKNKTISWNIEEETRIVCQAFMKFEPNSQEFQYFPYLDLNLEDEFFRDMEIILNPWKKDDSLLHLVEKAKNESTLCSEVKQTINIVESCLLIETTELLHPKKGF